MANQWLRLWHDMPTDPKWRTIAKASGQRIGDVMAVYVHLLVTASNATERGRTQSFNSEDVASALDIETEQVAAIVDAMQGRVLDGDAVKGWEKRQVAREDGAAERSRAWREEKKALKSAESNASERSPNASERKRTQPERNRTPDTDTDTDKDKTRKENTSPDGDVISAERAATSRGTRLPADWGLPMAWGKWALTEYPHWSVETVRVIAAGFADHWHAKAGKDAAKLDWEATWRNWCRGDITQRAHPALKAAGPNKQEALEADGKRVAREWLAQQGEAA